jgi:hypothetical protein
MDVLTAAQILRLPKLTQARGAPIPPISAGGLRPRKLRQSLGASFYVFRQRLEGWGTSRSAMGMAEL